MKDGGPTEYHKMQFFEFIKKKIEATSNVIEFDTLVETLQKNFRNIPGNRKVALHATVPEGWKSHSREKALKLADATGDQKSNTPRWNICCCRRAVSRATEEYSVARIFWIGNYLIYFTGSSSRYRDVDPVNWVRWFPKQRLVCFHTKLFSFEDSQRS